MSDKKKPKNPDIQAVRDYSNPGKGIKVQQYKNNKPSSVRYITKAEQDMQDTDGEYSRKFGRYTTGRDLSREDYTKMKGASAYQKSWVAKGKTASDAMRAGKKDPTGSPKATALSMMKKKPRTGGGGR
jgi:hypothetical protein